MKFLTKIGHFVLNPYERLLKECKYNSKFPTQAFTMVELKLISFVFRVAGRRFTAPLRLVT
jgi:hypothetical protein